MHSLTVAPLQRWRNPTPGGMPMSIGNRRACVETVVRMVGDWPGLPDTSVCAAAPWTADVLTLRARRRAVPSTTLGWVGEEAGTHAGSAVVVAAQAAPPRHSTASRHAGPLVRSGAMRFRLSSP